MAAFLGKWNFKSYENLTAFMHAIGVPAEMKAKAMESKPSIEICQNGDTWTIKTQMSDKSKDVSFQIGQEFDHHSLIGHPVKSTISMEGEKMVENQIGGGTDVLITREVIGGELIIVATTQSVSTTFRYQKA